EQPGCDSRVLELRGLNRNSELNLRSRRSIAPPCFFLQTLRSIEFRRPLRRNRQILPIRALECLSHQRDLGRVPRQMSSSSQQRFVDAVRFLANEDGPVQVGIGEWRDGRKQALPAAIPKIQQLTAR